jgi:hypothetical protein
MIKKIKDVFAHQQLLTYLQQKDVFLAFYLIFGTKVQELVKLAQSVSSLIALNKNVFAQLKPHI